MHIANTPSDRSKDFNFSCTPCTACSSHTSHTQQRTTEQLNITSCSLPQLQTICSDMGLKPFRVHQIVQWLYPHFVHSFNEMTNLSKELRAQLEKRFTLHRCKIAHTQHSTDGSRKYLIVCPDNTRIETVAMPSDDGRLTICISTQAGCAVGCAFCATGQAGFVRNLFSGEIIDQVLLAQQDMAMRVSNVVFMGQGEPFANYQHTLAALNILNSPQGLAIGARKLTVSTSGIIPRIQDFGQLDQQYGLAVSLHSALQPTRDQLMPGVSQFTLPNLKQALLEYYHQSGRRPTLEYALINGVNTDRAHIQSLIDFNRNLNAFINLINLNAVADSPFTPVSPRLAQQIQQELQVAGYEVALRRSRGQDIDAACGQLAQKLRG